MTVKEANDWLKQLKRLPIGNQVGSVLALVDDVRRETQQNIKDTWLAADNRLLSGLAPRMAVAPDATLPPAVVGAMLVFDSDGALDLKKSIIVKQ